MNLSDREEAAEKLVTLDQLKKLVSFQRVVCEIKVIDVETAEEVSGGSW